MENDWIEKVMDAGWSLGELFGVTRRQAARIVKMLDIERLHQYIFLLERGLGSHEARETVWGVSDGE